ncbi:GNAT family N-acetyltransferase [Paenibacillus terrigena]|uniref:GNAT family N-acetyltransferase n=1 Tax=Paenibacillus terrigena TaxID=369333 RepID=UPI0028D5F2E0|nr:GNAT family N-acetyltransferase [Paenibacillus terrigena]
MFSENNLTIECEDIILREYRIEDVDALYQLTWEPHFHAFLIDWNVSRDQRVEWMTDYEIPENERILQAVAEGGDIGELRLRLSIIDRATGEFIGVCGTGILDRITPPKREIYYGISKDVQNQGYTTQAAKALIGYLFQLTTIQELIAIAQIRNIASNKVIQKCGFTLQHNLTIEEQDYHYYTLQKNE